VEVYDFTFNGEAETYENIVKHFFMFHDPTTLNQQGNDRGTQYASAIFCYDSKQVRSKCDQSTNIDRASSVRSVNYLLVFL
jgi:peptide methionine sulfoxide reductase MsrA